jgi:hypothetical protein
MFPLAAAAIVAARDERESALSQTQHRAVPTQKLIGKRSWNLPASTDASEAMASFSYTFLDGAIRSWSRSAMGRMGSLGIVSLRLPGFTRPSMPKQELQRKQTVVRAGRRPPAQTVM